jgi:Protein of unknown function (DUF3604)
MKISKAWLLVFSIALLFIASPAYSIDPWEEPLENAYFGDLHVHTNYSFDAFLAGMPQGRYVDEAGQYALYCSRLDFYSITDHAEMLTDTNYWAESIRTAKYFNDLGAENLDENGDPSIVVFTGWEWTLSYKFGHKNIILKHDDPEKLPPSPIRARPGIQGFPKSAQDVIIGEEDNIFSAQRVINVPYAAYYGYRRGDDDTTFVAPESGDLFRLLRKYCTEAGNGCEAQVIPHGNAWGIAPVMDTMWDPQLDPINHDEKIQSIIEVYSGHGNSEEYFDMGPNWIYLKDGTEAPASECLIKGEPGALLKMVDRAIGGDDNLVMSPDCTRKCPEPTGSFEACCWRAGEIVRERCADPKSKWCKEQIELARQNVKPFPNQLSTIIRNKLKPEYHLNPGKVEHKEWKSCGQCIECWQPAANYRAHGSVQKALASAYFDEDGKPLHYRFGFIGSTDTHSAWPGSVKESKRQIEPNSGAVGFTGNIVGGDINLYPGWERSASFFNPGGLAVILSDHRTRDDLWDNFIAKNIYSTSGPRMEVWARAVVDDKVIKMGSEVVTNKNPTFHVKANGAFVEDDTCPYDDEPMISSHFSKEEFDRVCQSQCYRTKDERVAINRIEVVKILQPMTPEEAGMATLKRSKENPNGLIIDPYHVEDLKGVRVEWSWTDKEFVNESSGRSVAYYFRIIQEPTPGYNCDIIGYLDNGRLCDPKNPYPSEVEALGNPQDGSDPVSYINIEDECYSDENVLDSYCEERAWTSPFFLIKG